MKELSLQDWIAILGIVWGLVGQIKTWYLKRHQLPKPLQAIFDALSSCGLSIEAVQAEIASIESKQGLTSNQKRDQVAAWVISEACGLPKSTANFIVEYALELWDARAKK